MKGPRDGMRPCPGDGTDAAVLLEGLEPRLRSALEAVAACSRDTDVPAHLVGGPVRDLLLGLPLKDLDVMVEGDGIAFAEALAKRVGGRTVNYRRFGTALVVTPGRPNVDVATARTETYPEPGALPEVGPGTLPVDLLRRDFSINAFALRLGPDGWGRFEDPHTGCADLAAGLLRVLHPGSFRDDPTRIFRAVRFEARYGLQMERATRVLLEAAVSEGLLDAVSRERIRAELVAILSEEAPAGAVGRLGALGIWEAVCAPLPVPEDPVGRLAAADRSLAWYAGLASRGAGEEAPEPWVLRWLLLAADPPGEAALRVSRDLLLGKRVQHALEALRERWGAARHFLERPYHGADSALFEILTGLPSEALLWLHATCTGPHAEGRLERYLRVLEPMRPWVDGKALRELGVRPGPRMGALLDRLFKAQMDGSLRSPEDALQEARRLVAGGTEGD